MPINAGSKSSSHAGAGAGTNALLPRARALIILLVEDHDDSARVLVRLLRREGHTVCHAASVREALEIGGRQYFDLLIADLGLPDGSGLDILPTLQTYHPRLRGIALTGYAADGDAALCREAGYARHLAKPVAFAELLNAVHARA